MRFFIEKRFEYTLIISIRISATFRYFLLFHRVPYFMVSYNSKPYMLLVILFVLKNHNNIGHLSKSTAVADKLKICNGSLSASVSKFLIFTLFIVLDILLNMNLFWTIICKGNSPQKFYNMAWPCWWVQIILVNVKIVILTEIITAEHSIHLFCFAFSFHNLSFLITIVFVKD